jgi:peptidoglycan/LPS O-acetylase OafA/YrhL
MMAWLGYGKQFLNFTNGLLKYASQAAYPSYILHQTVIVMIAYRVIKWKSSVPVKFWVIVGASLVITLVLYDLLVKRINVMRFLFGLKPKRKQPQEVKPEPTSA